RAQALNELGSFGTAAPAVLAGLPEMIGRKHAWHQRAAAQLAGTHSFRQGERAQTLSEELGQTAHIRRRCREPQHASRRRRMPVPQQTFELHDTTLACLEKFPEICP